MWSVYPSYFDHMAFEVIADTAEIAVEFIFYCRLIRDIIPIMRYNLVQFYFQRKYPEFHQSNGCMGGLVFEVTTQSTIPSSKRTRYLKISLGIRKPKTNVDSIYGCDLQ